MAMNEDEIRAQGDDAAVRKLADDFLKTTYAYRYSFHFTWLGQPIIQIPQDLMAWAEIIMHNKPDLIIETGSYHGGSALFFASMLELIGGDGRVISIDAGPMAESDLTALRSFGFARRMTLIAGARSVSQVVLDRVASLAEKRSRIMVVLDSDHFASTVRQELEAYAPYVTTDQYLIVCDTVVEDMPEQFPEFVGNGPRTAVREFLKTTDRFEVDRSITDKIVLSVSPEGYLRCLKR